MSVAVFLFWSVGVMMFAILYDWQRLFEGGLRSRCSTTSMLRLGFDRQFHLVYHLFFLYVDPLHFL